MVARERVPDFIARAYDAAAAGYDTWHWSAFWDAHEVPVVRSLVADAPDGLFVDAGCGTGRYRTLARRLGRPYVGLDISPQMLAVGAARLGGSLPADRLMKADLRASGLPAAAATVLLCARTLCHVRDLAASFAEFARITERGGSLIVCDLHPAFRVPVTRLPTPTGKREVLTFRRTPEALARAARRAGFTCSDRFDIDAGGGDSFFILRLIRG